MWHKYVVQFLTLSQAIMALCMLQKKFPKQVVNTCDVISLKFLIYESLCYVISAKMVCRLNGK